jgi:hypothetical protein
LLDRGFIESLVVIDARANTPRRGIRQVAGLVVALACDEGGLSFRNSR